MTFNVPLSARSAFRSARMDAILLGMLDQDEIENAAEAVYEAVGLPVDAPAKMAMLADGLLGPRAVRVVPARALPGDAALARVNTRRYVYVREGLDQRRQGWAIAHEVAEFWLAEEGYNEPDVELLADRLAAVLLGPRAAVLVAWRALGDDIASIAKALGGSQSYAGLRIGEVTGSPLCLVSPKTIRTRGGAFEWPDEETLRSRRAVPGLRKVKLTDDRKRTLVAAI